MTVPEAPDPGSSRRPQGRRKEPSSGMSGLLMALLIPLGLLALIFVFILSVCSSK